MGGRLGVPCATRPAHRIILRREVCTQVGCSHLGIILPLFFQGWLGVHGDQPGVWGDCKPPSSPPKCFW